MKNIILSDEIKNLFLKEVSRAMDKMSELVMDVRIKIEQNNKNYKIKKEVWMRSALQPLNPPEGLKEYILRLFKASLEGGLNGLTALGFTRLIYNPK